MGTAAAMQALKKFTSGSNDNSGGKNDFVSLAMGEASKVSLMHSRFTTSPSGDLGVVGPT